MAEQTVACWVVIMVGTSVVELAEPWVAAMVERWVE